MQHLAVRDADIFQETVYIHIEFPEFRWTLVVPPILIAVVNSPHILVVVVDTLRAGNWDLVTSALSTLD